MGLPTFTDQQLNIINGLLLGDGHLSLKGKAKNASLIVKRALKDIEYSKYHVSIFKDHVTESGLKSKTRFDKRTNKYYKYCDFSLKASPELTNIYNKWYCNKKKIIPLDLKLNNEIIATWLCDDGWVKKSKNNYFEIGFATNGFTLHEVEFLKNLLIERYNENIGTCYTGKSKQKIIYLSDYVARKLIIDIDKVFPLGMERKKKWDGVEFPPPNQSIKLSSQKRKQQVAEFIKNNSNFYLIELAKYLDWKYEGPDGNFIFDTQNSKRYLKKYLDSNIIKFDYKDRKGNHYTKIESIIKD